MTENPILEDIKQNVDIVPYTRTDRLLQYAIAIIVSINLIGILIGLIWGI